MTEKQREKYRPFIHERGGIFTSKARKRLLGLSPGRPGWTEETSDFRSDRNHDVKQALVDLEMFIEVADSKDVNKVLNEGSLRPVIAALLSSLEPDRSRAEIADMFVSWGLDYLVSTVSRDNPVIAAFQTDIDKIVQLSYLLVRSFEGG